VADYVATRISVIDVSLDDTATQLDLRHYLHDCGGHNPGKRDRFVGWKRLYGQPADQTVTVASLTSYTRKRRCLSQAIRAPWFRPQIRFTARFMWPRPDSPYLTIIATGGTNPDTVDTTLDL